MIFATSWKSFDSSNHPELSGINTGEPLLSLKFIDESSVEAITQKAIKMRSMEMFQEPYDPPEYLL